MTVKGVDELPIRFATMQDNISDKNIGEILNWGLNEVEVGAKAAAPVLTGRLRDSIVHYMISDLSGECAAMAPYAGAQEYGFITGSGANISGKNYFRPSAMRGTKVTIVALNKYLIDATKGVKVAPPTAARGSRSSSGAKKYQYKQLTGAGTRYVYAKTTQPTKFRFQGRPGGRKQPSTSFQRPKPGIGARR